MCTLSGIRDGRQTDGQADIASKKKELAKQTLQVKTRQKEVQTAELEIRASNDPAMMIGMLIPQSNSRPTWKQLSRRLSMRLPPRTRPRRSLRPSKTITRFSRYGRLPIPICRDGC